MTKKIVLSLLVVLLIAGAIVALLQAPIPRDAQGLLLWYKAHLNYTTVMALMTIESSFIPFPSEIVVPPAAYFAVKDGALNIYLVVFFATLGALLGALINYVLALFIGRPLVYRFVETKLGRLFLLDARKVEHAEAYFDKHGVISTLLGRMIPAVRQLISIPAGLARMNLLLFCLFTSIGAGIWNAVLAGLGYWLGLNFPEEQLYEKLEYYNKYLTYAGYALFALIVVFLVFRMMKKKDSAST